MGAMEVWLATGVWLVAGVGLLAGEEAGGGAGMGVVGVAGVGLRTGILKYAIPIARTTTIQQLTITTQGHMLRLVPVLVVGLGPCVRFPVVC